MRSVAAVRVVLEGDKGAAAAHIPYARVLLETALTLGLPVRRLQMQDGTRIAVRADVEPPVITIESGQPAPAPVPRFRLCYQFLSTGPVLLRATGGTPAGDAVRAVFAVDEDAQVVAVPVASGSTLEEGDWPVFGDADGIFRAQPVTLVDPTLACPEAFWPDAGLAEGHRSARVLFGPRLDGYAATAMGGHNNGTRARQVSASHPYAERGEGAPLLWYSRIDTRGVTVRMPGLDAVHGHGVIRASHPTYGTRDLLVAVDSYSRLWVSAPGGVAQAIDLPLPDWVFLGPDDADVSERACYKWRFSPDGAKLCAVVFERYPPVVDAGLNTIFGERRTSVFLDAGAQESAPILLDAGGLVEMALTVDLTGRGRDDFRPSVTLFRARRTEDFGCGIMAADYAWTDGALVLATVDVYVQDEFDPLDFLAISVMTVAREGEAPALRARLYANHVRIDSGVFLEDYQWTGIAGLDLRALAGCFVVKSWRQTRDGVSRVAHTLDVSILAYMDGALVEQMDSNAGALAEWLDVEIPPGMHRLEIGAETQTIARAARSPVTAGDGATLVDAGLWGYGPIAAAYNDADPIRAMTAHPDGHYAICTVPTLTYTGAFITSGDAPYTYAIEGFDSLMLDVICVRKLGEQHRMRHLDALNDAFGHAWTERDFAVRVLPSGGSGFQVTDPSGLAESIYSARYVFLASEYAEQFRPASASSRAWSRGLCVEAPILAAQSVFWWKEVK